MRPILAVAALATVMACSSGSGTGGNGGGSGSTGGGSGSMGGGSGSTGGGSGSTGGGGGSTGGGGGSTGGGSGSTGGGSGSGMGIGLINVTSSCFDAGAMVGTACEGSASAQFSSGGSGGSCTSTMEAGCTVLHCQFGPNPDGGTPAVTFDNAGAITIGGTRVDGGVTMAFNPALGYRTFSETQWFNPGDALTVSAAGANVPAFSGESVTAPGDVTILTPACSQNTCGTVNAAVDFTATWNGSSTVQVALSSAKLDAGTIVQVACQFTSAPGTIQASLLSHLGKSSDGYQNVVSVEPVGQTSFSAGNYQVMFTATNGDGVSGSVTVQ